MGNPARNDWPGLLLSGGAMNRHTWWWNNRRSFRVMYVGGASFICHRNQTMRRGNCSPLG